MRNLELKIEMLQEEIRMTEEKKSRLDSRVRELQEKISKINSEINRRKTNSRTTVNKERSYSSTFESNLSPEIQEALNARSL